MSELRGGLLATSIGMLDVHRLLDQSSECMNSVADTFDLFVWTLSETGRVLSCSPGVTRILGVEPDVLLRTESSWQALVYEEDWPMIQSKAHELFASKKAFNVQYRARDAHGRLIWLQSWAIAIQDESGLCQYEGVTMDVTALVTAESAIKDVQRRYETLLHLVPDAVVVHRNGRIRYANLRTLSLLGYELTVKTVERPISRVIHRADRVKFRRHVQELAQERADDAVSPVEIRLLRQDGTVLFVECASRVVTEDGATSVISVFKDISERKRAEDELRYMAFHDALTGLPNRRQFHEQVTSAITACTQSAAQAQVAVLLVDMDRFKNINDTHGHSFGDLALQAMAERLRQFAPETATLFRLGGDEFVILHTASVQQAKSCANRLLEAFSESLCAGDLEFVITPSIGIALYPDHGQDSGSLLKHADLAMYAAKSQGGNHYAFYEPSGQSALVERTQLELSLRRALERSEFVLYYQPKYELAGQTPCAAEALVRWLRPGHGVVAPGSFISVMEESDMIAQLGTWVLHEACRQMRSWHDAGLRSFHVSVNVSPRQFQVCDMATLITSTLAAYSLPPDCLTIEITEGLLIHNSQEIAATLRAIRQAGVGVAIDDFGTGYSSLRYLQLFHPNILKIDQSFVQGMMSDPEQFTIVKTLVQLAHNLGMLVVAEGVETAEQVAALSAQGCELAQGYYYAKPLPASDFADRFLRFQ